MPGAAVQYIYWRWWWLSCLFVKRVAKDGKEEWVTNGLNHAEERGILRQDLVFNCLTITCFVTFSVFHSFFIGFLPSSLIYSKNNRINLILQQFQIMKVYPWYVLFCLKIIIFPILLANIPPQSNKLNLKLIFVASQASPIQLSDNKSLTLMKNWMKSSESSLFPVSDSKNKQTAFFSNVLS